MKKGANDEYGRKITQGSVKMERYLNELVRNAVFRRLIKRMKKTDLKEWPSGIETQVRSSLQLRSDRELVSILEGYKLLRKRVKRITGKAQKLREKISEEYGLDSNLIMYAEAKILGKTEWEKSARGFADPDFCRIEDIGWENIHPMNEGEEIIHLNTRVRESRKAFPIAITIHQRATKADILDFIEKRWPWIENMLRPSELSGLKYRPQKHPQKMLDFLWKLRHLSSGEIKKRLDEIFPENGLAYFEINAVLRSESKKRYGYINEGR